MPVDPELNASSVSLGKEILLGLTAIGASCWTILRFVFEPRLHQTIEERATAKVAPLLESIDAIEEKLVMVERDAALRKEAVDRMTVAVDRSSVLLEKVAEKLEKQGESLAYIEGTMRARAPRRQTDSQDEHYG